MTNGVADVDVDLAVIGGGRAGSTAITSLAQQYRATENAGDGRAMIADASAFLDPPYSPGVLLALRSKKAAEVDDARSVGSLYCTRRMRSTLICGNCSDWANS